MGAPGRRMGGKDTQTILAIEKLFLEEGGGWARSNAGNSVGKARRIDIYDGLTGKRQATQNGR